MNLWEIIIKSRLGKLRTDVDEFQNAVLQSGFQVLIFKLEDAAEVAKLPDHHRDPLDRGLVAQAKFEPMHLLTHNQALALYGDSVLVV